MDNTERNVKGFGVVLMMFGAVSIFSTFRQYHQNSEPWAWISNLIFGILYIGMGICTIKLKQWMRIVILFLSYTWLILMLGLFLYCAGTILWEKGWNIKDEEILLMLFLGPILLIFTIAIPGLVIDYFKKDKVKDLFEKNRTA
jgi:hypothetical protein